MRYEGFEWDEGNWPKCAKHGVSKDEIERLFDEPLTVLADRSKSSEERFNAVGRTADGRHVFVVFAVRDRLIRPISARFMHRKEIEAYERR